MKGGGDSENEDEDDDGKGHGDSILLYDRIGRKAMQSENVRVGVQSKNGIITYL